MPMALPEVHQPTLRQQIMSLPRESNSVDLGLCWVHSDAQVPIWILVVEVADVQDMARSFIAGMCSM